MLSAITHAHDSQITAILRALATALRDVDEEDRALIIEMTELGLGRTQAVETWRTLMSISLSYFRSETSQRLRAEGHTVGFDEGMEEGLEKGLEKGVQKGRAEAVAEMILHLLDVRDVPTTAKVRRRIQACTDLDTLDTWFHRSINAATGDDIVTG